MTAQAGEMRRRSVARPQYCLRQPHYLNMGWLSVRALGRTARVAGCRTTHRHTPCADWWSNDSVSVLTRQRGYELGQRLEFRRVVFCFQAEDGIRDWSVTGVQTCALPISSRRRHTRLVSDWSSDVCSSDLGQSRL